VSQLLLKKHASAPATPVAGKVNLYTDTVPALKFVDDGGNTRTVVDENNTLTFLNKTFTSPVYTGAYTGTSLAVTGALTSSSASNPFGYATGAGGSVTQLTNNSTAVTLNTIAGQIITQGSTVNAAVVVAFTLNNSTIADTDVVAVCISAGPNPIRPIISVTAVASGSCVICYKNVSTAVFGVPMTINFTVLKAVSA
jgi:hypothetical protein